MFLNYLLLGLLVLSIGGNLVVYYAEVLPSLARANERDFANRAQNGFYYLAALKRYAAVCRRSSRFPTGLVLSVAFQVIAVAATIYLFWG